MRLDLASSGAIRLLCLGSRCGTTMKATPLSAGIASKNFLRAFSPPAEATIPTTNGAARLSLRGAALGAALCGRLRFRFRSWALGAAGRAGAGEVNLLPKHRLNPHLPLCAPAPDFPARHAPAQQRERK